MKSFIITVLLSFCFIISFAQTPVAEVLKHDIRIEFDGERLNKFTSVSIQINSKEGLDYATVFVSTSGIHTASNIQAEITDISGERIRKLKKKDIVIKSAIASFSFYEDDYVNEFSMIHNEYPYVLHYSFQQSFSNYLNLTYWYPILHSDIPTRSANLDLLVPKTSDLKIKEHLIESPTITKGEENTLYHWEAKNLKPMIKEEIYSPSLDERYPYVWVKNKDFHFGIDGSLESWENLGYWHHKFLNGLNDLPSSEKQRIDSLIAGIKNDKEKIEKLYLQLQKDTRYINVSIKLGGLKPYPASYVAENKYGDCKALGFYFKSVLEYIGIKAYYTKINAGDKIVPIDLNYPSQQFNHIILLVPLENDTLWIDATTDMSFAYVGTFIQDRYALSVNGKESFLAKTPALAKEDVTEYRNMTLKKEASNNMKVEVENLYRGDKYEYLFQVKEYVDQDYRNKLLKTYFTGKKMDFPDDIIIEIIEGKPEISLSYQTTANSYMQKLNGEILIDVPGFGLEKIGRARNRKLPIQIDYPIHLKDKIVYELASQDEVLSLPKEQNLETKFGTYEVSASQNSNVVTIEKSFYLKAGKYPLEEYEAFYKFYKKAQKSLIFTLSDK